MGLLSIWDDYWRKNEPQEDGTYGSSTDFSKRQVNRFNRSNLSTAGGVDNSGASADMDQRIPRKRGEIPTPPKYIRQKKEVRDRLGRVIQPGSPINAPGTVGHPMMNKTFPVPPQDARKTPNLAKNTVYQDAIMRGGKGANIPQDLNWWQKLSGMFNSKFDMDGAMANWEKKGGFEGLMSNPAFTMGLAFLQAGAEGKTLGAGALDNVMKAGGISQHYKKIIENRSGDVIEATEGMMDDIKGVLGEMNISGPGWRKMLPGNQSASYEQAVEDITIKVQQKIDAMKAEADKSGKKIVVGKRLKKKVIQEMIDSGEINTKRVFFDKTLETKAQGGPVQAGKPYVVGEKGPEVIIPRSDGNVLANDDSQIFARLLASNTQLQNVSKQRAERILRSRFPEYFEG